MRLFVALDIDDGIRSRIARFLDGVRGLAPEARWVRPESLHVTLKFIGEKSEDEAAKIKLALSAITQEGFDLSIRGYGFFPGAQSPRVFWIGVEASPKLDSLAAAVDENLAVHDIPREEHPFNPHLTLARSASRSDRKSGTNNLALGLRNLRTKLEALPQPEFGTMTAREFYLYQSQLSPKGSHYTKLVAYALR